ncbi:MAG TPA: response regulator [Anaerolineales bacterium]|nr:response regulator [Anaerolineales bacterium]
MARECILIVEDYVPLLVALREILEGEGYTVHTAADGVQALEALEEVLPDLIVADVMMPHMDGYGLYEAVRAHPDWASIPFIFLTAKAEQEDVLRGKGLGAEDYITKPFDPRELVRMISACLRGGTR